VTNTLAYHAMLKLRNKFFYSTGHRKQEFNLTKSLNLTAPGFGPEAKTINIFIGSMEQHILDTNTGKQLF
jgi:hypothetical protein